jgi:ubiquinone/menaquinone biosynthesis C-methylase UbiE
MRASKGADPKRIVEEGYDRVADKYARLEGEEEWPRLRWVEKLLRRLEPGSFVLDLGCGSGDPADIEISKRHEITGVDISQAQIRLARDNVPSGNFVHADAASVRFPAASFHAVVSFYTLEHLPRVEHAPLLRRVQRWLREGGYLLLSMEAAEEEGIVSKWLDVPMFFSCFDPETMRHLIEEAGFEIVETAIETQVEQGNEIPYLWVLARKRPKS